MELLRLEKKLPPSHRGGFWSIFINAVDKELQNLYLLAAEKKKTFDISTMNVSGLIEISDLLGVSFDANIDDSVEYIRREVYETPFKIQYKDTASLYLSFARAIGRKSQLFVYFYKAAYQKIIRNADDPLATIDAFVAAHGVHVPYPFTSSNNFTGQQQTVSKLDTGMSLDSALNALTLDNVQTTTATNHLGFEYEIDRLIMKNSDAARNGKVLVQWEAVVGAISYNLYWSTLANFSTTSGNKISGVTSPYTHSGLTNGTVYYYIIEAVNAGAVEYAQSTVDIPYCMTIEYLNYIGNLVNEVKRVKEVPHVGSQLNLMCDQSHTVNNVPILNAKIMTTSNMDGMTPPYRLSLTEIQFGTGVHDDIETVMPTALSLPITTSPIFFDETGESALWVWGSAAYTEMNTNVIDMNDGSGYIGPGSGSGVTGVDEHFTGTLPVDSSWAITRPKLIFSLKVGSVIETIVDDGNGHLTGSVIDGALPATVDYITGAYLFTMTTGILTASSSKITVAIQQPLPATKITEAGLFAMVGLVKKMIAYATFPPVEVEARYHLNMQFMIKKGTF